MSEFVRFRENKTPLYICEDCGVEYTHFNNKMLILKDDVWLSIAEKKTVLCDVCIAKRLGRAVTIDDLWRNYKGEISGINEWYAKTLKL